MVQLRYLSLIAFVLASTTYSVEVHSNGTQFACARLKESYPELTLFPGEASYVAENQG